MRKIFPVFIALFFLSAALLRAADSEEGLVSLRFLEMQKQAKTEFAWERGEIRVKVAGNEVRLFLNVPFAISGTRVEKIDTPPFVEDGRVFMGQQAYDAVSALLDSEAPKQEKLESGQPFILEAPKETYAGTAPAAVVRATQAAAPAKTAEKQQKTAVPEDTARPQKKERKLIVLDPGHGGKDPGAIGPNGLYEKDVVLGVGLKVREYLKKYPVDVMMTRDDDTFIQLKDRAVFANRRGADLFISIHCNASRDRGAEGTRTYIYSRVASSKYAAETAKFENKAAGAFEFLLNDLRKTADEYLSIEAAGNIQHCLVKNLRLKWLPTERAPFYVLANSDMPSVLVEAAFISNRTEAQKLGDDSFRDKVAQGITEGIIEYLKKVK